MQPTLGGVRASFETASGLQVTRAEVAVCEAVRAIRAPQEQPETEAERGAVDETDGGGCRQCRNGGGGMEVQGSDVHEELGHGGVFRRKEGRVGPPGAHGEALDGGGSEAGAARRRGRNRRISLPEGRVLLEAAGQPAVGRNASKDPVAETQKTPPRGVA